MRESRLHCRPRFANLTRVVATAGLWWGAATALASSGKPPAKVTGEVNTPGPSDDLVQPAQKPAPEVEAEIENGGRAPATGPIELRIDRREDGRFRVDQVDPRGPFSGQYKQGDVVDTSQLPGPANGPNGAPAKSSGAGPTPDASH